MQHNKEHYPIIHGWIHRTKTSENFVVSRVWKNWSMQHTPHTLTMMDLSPAAAAAAEEGAPAGAGAAAADAVEQGMRMPTIPFVFPTKGDTFEGTCVEVWEESGESEPADSRNPSGLMTWLASYDKRRQK